MLIAGKHLAQEPYITALGCKFYGIGQEVQQYFGQFQTVCAHKAQFVKGQIHMEIDSILLSSRANGGNQMLQHGACLHHFIVQLFLAVADTG